jgi:hypothetical protein
LGVGDRLRAADGDFHHTYSNPFVV